MPNQLKTPTVRRMGVIYAIWATVTETSGVRDVRSGRLHGAMAPWRER